MSVDTARKDPFGLVGTLLDGRFHIEREVAEGGFGVVYSATQIALDRPVAIKVLKAPTGFDEAAKVQFRDRFASEAKTIAKIRHPHIVDVYDFGISQLPSGEIAPWMALEWLEGETLEDQLQRRRGQGGRKPAEVLAIVRPILQAFAFAHKQGIAHRDIKPANIMAVPGEHGVMMRVLDFGIAKLVTPEEEAGTGHTKTSSIPAFSPHYAAPEQIAFGRTGPWTDVHALGLILTELLTDQPPYGATDIQLFEEIISSTRPTPSAKGIDVGGWEPVLRKAAALSPGERWRSAAELLAALEANPGDRTDGAAVAGIQSGGSPGRTVLMTQPPSSTLAGSNAAAPGSVRRDRGAAAPRRSTRGRLPMAVGAVVLCGAVAAALFLREPANKQPVVPSPPATRVSPPAPAASPGPSPAAPGGDRQAALHAAQESRPAPAAVASAGAASPPGPSTVQIEIRTDPPAARLAIDHHEVPNPYLSKATRGHHLHDISATLPGFGDVHELIAFDRDRALTLRLAAKPIAPGGIAPAAEKAPVREQPPAPTAGPTGYRGSKLKIETEFP